MKIEQANLFLENTGCMIWPILFLTMFGSYLLNQIVKSTRIGHYIYKMKRILGVYVLLEVTLQPTNKSF